MHYCAPEDMMVVATCTRTHLKRAYLTGSNLEHGVKQGLRCVNAGRDVSVVYHFLLENGAEKGEGEREREVEKWRGR